MLKQRALSLTQRLLLSAAVLMVLFLGATGFILDRAFVNSQLVGQGERLYIRIINLVSIAELDGDTLYIDRLLREERFNSPESGLIGIVLNAQRQPVWESLSSEWFAEQDALQQSISLQPGESEVGRLEEFVFQRNGFVWEGAGGVDHFFEFWVLEDASPIDEAIAAYRQQLWGGLAASAVALLVVLVFVTRWGLAPLRQLALQLHQIRHGEQAVLTGRYPSELSPLTDSLNQLIVAEQNQRVRYRNAMGDLAHSLKTPLAVLKTLTATDQTALNEQVDRMNQIVRYQLQRAVTDARDGPVLGQRCDLTAALARLSRALERAFLEDDKVLELPESQAPVLVAMDSNDVLEVLGNLIENAFKYGRSVICVELNVVTEQHQVQVMIDDDGPGVSEPAQQQILQRGKRLDSLQPGHGIGLAMVNDILESYSAPMSIERSPFGGARFVVTLPLVH